MKALHPHKIKLQQNEETQNEDEKCHLIPAAARVLIPAHEFLAPITEKVNNLVSGSLSECKKPS